MNVKATLVEAFRGAYAVFAVTNYWEKMDTNLEIQQGKNLADAAVVSWPFDQTYGLQADYVSQEVGIQHFIWSSLLNIKKC